MNRLRRGGTFVIQSDNAGCYPESIAPAAAPIAIRGRVAAGLELVVRLRRLLWAEANMKWAEIVMKASEKLILAGLVILVGAAIAGLILTRSSSDSEAARGGRRTPSADRAPGIDRRTFETAQKLSGLAVTEEEERLAHEAL